MTWNTLRIKTKLTLSAALIIFFVCTLAVMGYVYFQKATDAVEHVVKNNYGRIQTFRDIKDAVDTIDKAMLSMTVDQGLCTQERGKGSNREGPGKIRGSSKESGQGPRRGEG